MRTRSGFTAIELLVALLIICVLLALIIPAVQNSRESMRRVQCVSHLRQIGLAVGMYESTHRVFPPGGPSQDAGYGWLVRLLPHLEQAALFAAVEKAASDPTQQTRMPESPVLFHCPSDSAYSEPALNLATSYAANSGTGLRTDGFNGMVRHWDAIDPKHDRGGPIRVSQVIDGLSNTVFASEILPSYFGSRDALRVNWDLIPPRGAPRPQPHGEFVQECKAGLRNYHDDGRPIGPPNRGSLWTWGDSNLTWYNHVLSPGSRSCLKNGSPQYGISSPSSLHRNGVNVVFADGHCQFVANAVDESAWKEMGSRVSQDLVSSGP